VRLGFNIGVIMIDSQTILDFCTQIKEQFEPIRIILFGSYAYGSINPDSDVDILVVLPFQGKAALKSAEILNRINPHFPVDLLVRTPEQVQERLQMGDFFMQEIIERGKILYEVAYS
jgi:predicted nucleotidyltransferase